MRHDVQNATEGGGVGLRLSPAARGGGWGTDSAVSAMTCRERNRSAVAPAGPPSLVAHVFGACS